MLLEYPVARELRASCAATFPNENKLAAGWNQLAGDVPFRRWEWIDSWWRHYQRPAMQPLIVTVHADDGELVGLAPWYIERSPLAGRVIRFMGSGEVCSDYLTVLAAPGLSGEVVGSVAGWLTTEAAGQWDLIDLDGVDASDSALEGLFAMLQSRGHVIHVRQRINSWRIELPATWDEYLARLAKRRREKVRQLFRRQFDTGRAVARLAQTDEEYARSWEIFQNLHQRRRESLGEQGCFSSAAFGTFHAEVTRRFFDAGRLRMHWVEMEGTPLAIEYGLSGGDTVYYYQSGLDPDRSAERPGWLEVAASIKLAIEQGYRYFDFLRGDEPYKSQWRGEKIPLQEVRVVGRHLSAKLRHQAWCGGVAARHWLKAGLQRVRDLLPGHKAAPAIESGDE